MKSDQQEETVLHAQPSKKSASAEEYPTCDRYGHVIESRAGSHKVCKPLPAKNLKQDLNRLTEN